MVVICSTQPVLHIPTPPLKAIFSFPTTLGLSVNGSHAAARGRAGQHLGSKSLYPLLLDYSSKRFCNPLGGYATISRGAVAVRDRPVEALSVCSANGRCRLTSSDPASAGVRNCG